MAGIDTRNTLPPAAAPQRASPSPQRSEVVKQAQRAFFNAALAGDTQAAAASSTTTKTPALTASASAPDARLRPGSIVDIKV